MSRAVRGSPLYTFLPKIDVELRALDEEVEFVPALPEGFPAGPMVAGAADPAAAFGDGDPELTRCELRRINLVQMTDHRDP